MNRKELIEALADLEHRSWARWMKYLFDKCQTGADGSITIPAGYVAALRVQMRTPYAALSEQEQQYDRDEVLHTMHLIDAYVEATP